jgi:hypothetical protein
MPDAAQMSEVIAAKVVSLKKDVMAGRDFIALREDVASLIVETNDRELVYSALEQLRAQFRAADDERSEDRVMDLMDLIIGWCGRDVKL